MHQVAPAVARASANREWTESERREVQELLRTLGMLQNSGIANQQRLQSAGREILTCLRQFTSLLPRLAAEFVVIVVGVLVALGVDSWANDRADRVSLFLLCEVLFPRQADRVEDFQTYFMATRKWFYGLLLAVTAIDVAESALKGPAYMEQLGGLYGRSSPPSRSSHCWGCSGRGGACTPPWRSSPWCFM